MCLPPAYFGWPSPHSARTHLGVEQQLGVPAACGQVGPEKAHPGLRLRPSRALKQNPTRFYSAAPQDSSRVTQGLASLRSDSQKRAIYAIHWQESPPCICARFLAVPRNARPCAYRPMPDTIHPSRLVTQKSSPTIPPQELFSVSCSLSLDPQGMRACRRFPALGLTTTRSR